MRRSKYSPKIVTLVAVVVWAVSVGGHGALAVSKGTGAVTKCSCSTGIGSAPGTRAWVAPRTRTILAQGRVERNWRC